MSSIAINGIHLRAAKGWPADEELSARQVVVRPDWGALMSRTIRIASIEIDDGYLSMLRRKDGKLVLLPALLGKAGDEGGKPEKADAAGESCRKSASAASPLRSAAIDFTMPQCGSRRTSCAGTDQRQARTDPVAGADHHHPSTGRRGQGVHHEGRDQRADRDRQQELGNEHPAERRRSGGLSAPI